MAPKKIKLAKMVAKEKKILVRTLLRSKNWKASKQEIIIIVKEAVYSALKENYAYTGKISLSKDLKNDRLNQKW